MSKDSEVRIILDSLLGSPSVTPKIDDAGPPPPAATDQRLLVAGFAREQEVFRVFSQPISRNPVKHALFISASGIAGNPTKPQRESVDRIAFYGKDGDGEYCIWEVAIVPTTMRTAEVRSAGAVNSKLLLQFFVRSFFRPTATSPTNVSDTTVRMKHLRPDSEVVVFEELSINLYGKIEDVPIEDLGAQTFPVITSDNGFDDPPFLERLGLVTDNVDSRGIKAQLRFRNAPAGSDRSFRRLILEYFMELQLAPGRTQRLKPFALSARTSDFPSVKPSRVNVVELYQRQPLSGPLIETGGGTLWSFGLSFPHKAVTELWNRAVVEPVLSAMQIVEAGRNLSFLPTIQDAVEGEVWRAWFNLIDRSDKVDFMRADDFQIAKPGNIVPAAGKVTAYPRALTPTPTDEPAPGGTEPGLKVKAAFTAVRASDSQSPTSFCSIQANGDHARYEQWKLDSFPEIEYRLVEFLPSMSPPGPTVRLQGLGLVFPELPAKFQDLEAAQSEVDSTESIRVTLDVKDDDNAVAIDREVSFSLSVLDLAPAGEDDTPGTEFDTDVSALEDPAPIVLSTHVEKSGPASPLPRRYLLVVTEGTTLDTSHTVAMRLRQLIAAPIQTDVLVIDTEPFLVARVVAQDLGEERSLTNEIGNWGFRAAQGFNWQVSLTGETFSLLLPPQGIGEAMHRYRDAGDVLPGEPIDMRFGSRAEARVFASDFRQRFTELPWNLRRRLGFPGQTAPGMAIDKLTVELVYGIRCEMSPKQLRLAEMQSRLGLLPRRLAKDLPWNASPGQKDLYSFFRERWDRSLQALQSRLAILEPGVPIEPRPVSAGESGRKPDLVISADDGLKVMLSHQAALAYPVPGVAPPAGVPRGGLRGSFAWAFESANVYDGVWRIPQAVEASLSSLMLSAMGGWGHLKAKFNGGITTIDAQVSMGRIVRLQVEQRGRMNIVGNRTRYVVIYDRTVAPSRQFMLEQHALLGNPVLRKTEEYLELDEPRRLFAKKSGTGATAEEVARGFAVGSLFPDGTPPRIHVNGRWGSDVGDIGWKIPIWLRGAAPADVYPKPDVRLLLASESDDEACPIDDPEKLYFFTRTDGREGANPDDWSPVRGIDFDVIGALIHENAESHNGSPDVDVPAIVDGTGAFTLTLASNTPVDLVRERAKNKITARLSTVTLVRGPLNQEGPAPKPGDAPFSDVSDLRDQIASSFVPARSLLSDRGSLSPADTLKSLQLSDNPVAAVRDRVVGGIEQLAAGVTNATDRIRGVVEHGTNNLAAFLKDDLEKRLKSLYGVFISQIEEEVGRIFDGAIDGMRALSVEILGDLDSPLDGDARLELTDALGEMMEGTPDRLGIVRQLRQVRGTPGEVDALSESASDQMLKVEEGIADELLEIAAIVSMLDRDRTEDRRQAEGMLSAFSPRLSDAIAAVEMIESEIGRRWLGNRPDKVRLAVQGGLLALRKAAIKLQYAARSEGDWVNAVIGATEEVEAAFAAYGIDLRSKAGDIWKALLDALPAESLSATKLLADAYESQVRKIIDSARTPRELFDRLDQQAEQFLKQLVSQRREVENAATTLIDQVIKRALDGLSGELDQVIAHVLPPLDEMRAYVNSIISKPEIQDLLNELERAKLSYGEMQAELDKILGNGRKVLTEFRDYAQAALRKEMSEVAGIGGKVKDLVQVLRGFGDAPKVPGLAFDRDILSGVAFTYLKVDGDVISTLDRVRTTLLSMGAGDATREIAERVRSLVPVNLQIPTKELAERFIPFNLQDLSVAEVFRNLAGFPCDDLFPDIPIPSIANDRVKVTQETNPQSLSGRVHIDVNLPFEGGEPMTVFSLAGVSLRLLNAEFKANVDILVRGSEPPRTRAQGSISGNWDLQIGGFGIAVLEQAALTFDETGHIHFSVSPAKIKLQQVLAFLSDLMKGFGDSNSGLSLRLTPAGVETILNLPLPDVQAGAFGLANLHLGFRFGLEVIPEFKITTALSVGRETAPFTLTIFILGGAGWFDFQLSYVPGTRKFTTRVSVALMASASLAISLGPISGGVYAYFGIKVQYVATQGQAGNLTVGLVLLFVGSVSLLGFIEVSLSLMLEAQYRSGGGLIGRGCVSYKIKIGWFINIEISADVSYEFGSAGGSESVAGGQVDQASIQVPAPPQLAIDAPRGEAGLVDQPQLAVAPQTPRVAVQSLILGDEYDIAARRYLDMFAADAIRRR